MPNKRNLRLDKYGISKKRYKELCGFCEQYPEWKMKIREHSLLQNYVIDGTPKTKNKGLSNPTLKSVIRLEALTSDCGIIERAAKLASDEFWEYIIKSVCYEVPITYLKMVDDMPIEKSAFYELRRYFFYLLDIERKKEREKRYIDVEVQESAEKQDGE